MSAAVIVHRGKMPLAGVDAAESPGRALLTRGTRAAGHSVCDRMRPAAGTVTTNGGDQCVGSHWWSESSLRSGWARCRRRSPLRNVTQVNVVYTNPQNDATVLRHAAGPVSETIISGDPQGVHTLEITVRGLSGLLRTADGVVLLGAGYLVLHEVFNGEEFVSREVVVSKGPHPNAESDLVLFCDVTTDALGLS
jgi:hypothetical protein